MHLAGGTTEAKELKKIEKRSMDGLMQAAEITGVRIWYVIDITFSIVSRK